MTFFDFCCCSPLLLLLKKRYTSGLSKIAVKCGRHLLDTPNTSSILTNSFSPILIYNNLYSICHAEFDLNGNGESVMPTIVHFQIPADDIERSKKFYNDLLGWRFDKFPSPGTDRLTESERIELKSFTLNINYNIMNSVVVTY